ncbi:MAG: hypothetical protein ABS75_05735 [Pelagibacterium sp. SCN 63-23]|nr:MAG: hypothetical protein ABS75_05735 [Pelagibacterium sp. SCN 63-23]
MGRFATFMISPTHRRIRRALAFTTMFFLFAGGAAWIVSEQLAQGLRAEIGRSLAAYGTLRANIVTIFDTMDAGLTAQPCSEPFIEQMRRITFLPDGISELLYAPDGRILCAGNSGWLDSPVELGAADVPASDEFGIALWLDRPLAPIGLPDLSGTIAHRGDYALVIPPQLMPEANGSDGLEEELVYRVGPDQWIHRSGIEGLHASALLAPQPFVLGLFHGVLYQTACDTAAEHCVAARTPLLPLVQQRLAAIALVLGALGVLAAWLTQQLCGMVERHWSFEARFLRRFDQRGLVCAYQPLLNLHNDHITGCEVLARWRDVDGTVVLPDQFLPIVEKHGLTERFTAMVVDRAHADLVQHLSGDQPLQVNFNIFPGDLIAARLVPMFAPLLADGARFEVVVELVETAEVEPEAAQVEIEKLRQAGIGVYIDDFGAGYSSMRNLAELSIDGVKLDRSFAMAPEDTVMARMLDHAIELVHASGRRLVVEGVEAPERLAALKSGGRVDFAQGYGIARPLTIEAFAAFLAEYGSSANGASRRFA